MYWIDYSSFLMHGVWFGVPFATGLVLMIYARSKLIEYLAWTVVLFHLAAVLFLIMPVSPPWMEGDVVRILEARNFYEGQTSIDNNPYAALPSLHAALPVLTALFLFTRGGRGLRFYAWLATVYSGAVSFAIIYMGEHWVIDVLAGYAVAGLTAGLFLSGRTMRWAANLPGDPVGRLARVNEKLVGTAGGSPVEALPEPAEPLPDRLAA
jgi:hypothetical protein